MRAASSEPTMRRRGRIARPISSARVSPRPVSALSLARLLLALFVPVREVSATRAFGSPAPVASAPGIIAAEGGRFVDPSDGSTFHVAGANCYYLVYSSGADEGSYEHDWVEEVLETSQQLNLNVLRVWTFQDQWWEKERALQTSPGEYNERFLIALDTLIARASAAGTMCTPPFRPLLNVPRPRPPANTYAEATREAAEGQIRRGTTGREGGESGRARARGVVFLNAARVVGVRGRTWLFTTTSPLAPPSFAAAAATSSGVLHAIPGGTRTPYFAISSAPCG